MDKATARNAYIQYWLENGKRPVSVYAFCQQLNATETDFYDSYASFDALEKDIWRAVLQETLDRLKGDQTYLAYSVREKLLAFYFLWVQQLREKRSYFLLQREKYLVPGPHLHQLDAFRDDFYEYIRGLIKEGQESGEIRERKFISDQYVHGFWIQAQFVLRYWLKDDSDRFEMTDAAIEKAVNLSFQLIGDHTIDSIIDFGKFMFARK